MRGCVWSRYLREWGGHGPLGDCRAKKIQSTNKRTILIRNMITLIIFIIYLSIWNLQSSVGLLTKLWTRPLGDPGSFLSRVRGTPNIISKICRILIAPEVKWTEREAHYSLSSDSRDNNSWSFASTVPFVIWRRAEIHKDTFTSWLIYLAFHIYWFVIRKQIGPG